MIRVVIPPRPSAQCMTREALGQRPVPGRPGDVGEMRRHVVTVVPELDPLGVVDALTQPVLAQVVLDQDRRAGTDHPVGAGGIRLPAVGPGARDGLFEQRPALGHPTCEHEAGANGRGHVERHRHVTDRRGEGTARLAVLDRRLEPPVEHVRCCHAGQQPGSHGLGCLVVGRPFQRVEGRVQSGHARVEVVAEQVANGDVPGDQRRSRGQVARLAEQLLGLLERSIRKLVLVIRDGLDGNLGEKGRPLGCRRARRQVPERTLEELERFAMCRHGGGAPAGRQRRGVRFGTASSLLEMDGSERVAEAGIIGRRVGHAPMQAPARRDREVVIERVPNESVTEVEPAILGRALDEELALELQQRGGQLFSRSRDDGCKEIEVEGAPDDGRRPGNGASARGEALGAAQDRDLESLRDDDARMDAFRRRCPAARDDVGAVGVDRHLGDGQELLHVERHTIGSIVDRADQVRRRRQVHPQDQRDHRRRSLAVQASDRRLLGHAPGKQARPPVPHRDTRIELVAAIGRDDLQRELRQSPRQHREDLEREIIGPVQVFERDQDRSGLRQRGEQVDDVEDEDATSMVGVADDRSGSCARQSRSIVPRVGPDAGGQQPLQPISSVCESRGTRETPGKIKEQAARDLRIPRERLPRGNQEARRHSASLDRPQQPCLPDPCLAGQEQQTAVTTRCLFEPPAGQREQVVAAHENGADRRPCRAHRPASVRTGVDPDPVVSSVRPRFGDRRATQGPWEACVRRAGVPTDRR